MGRRLGNVGDTMVEHYYTCRLLLVACVLDLHKVIGANIFPYSAQFLMLLWPVCHAVGFDGLGHIFANSLCSPSTRHLVQRQGEFVQFMWFIPCSEMETFIFLKSSHAAPF